MYNIRNKWIESISNLNNSILNTNNKIMNVVEKIPDFKKLTVLSNLEINLEVENLVKKLNIIMNNANIIIKKIF